MEFNEEELMSMKLVGSKIESVCVIILKYIITLIQLIYAFQLYLGIVQFDLKICLVVAFLYPIFIIFRFINEFIGELIKLITLGGE